MGSCLATINADDDFRLMHSPTTCVVNDLEADQDKAKQELQRLIYTVFEGNVYNDVPSCACGELTRAENSDEICPNCRQPVMRSTEREIEPILWARAPRGVVGFIQPHYWGMLRETFTVSGFDIMQWIANPKYVVQPKAFKLRDTFLRSFRQHGISLGWNSLVSNLVEIVTILTNHLPSKHEKYAFMRDLVIRDIGNIRSKHIPFTNRSLLVLEQNSMGRYGELSLRWVVDAAMLLRGIDLPSDRKTNARRQELSWKMIHNLSIFYEDWYIESLAQKAGLARKGLFSGRCRFSGRSVASSITDRHNYRDIYIPWYAATTILRPMIDNKLMAMGYTPREIERLVESHATREHPLLRKIFNELIDESPDGRGIPAIIQRNPSLERGSEQLVYITNVKSDRDNTVSISIFIVRGMNCDFDGSLIIAVIKLL